MSESRGKTDKEIRRAGWSIIAKLIDHYLSVGYPHEPAEGETEADVRALERWLDARAQAAHERSGAGRESVGRADRDNTETP